MKHKIRVIPLYDEDGDIEEFKYVCLTHGCEAIISMDFLKCLKEDPNPEIEVVE